MMRIEHKVTFGHANTKSVTMWCEREDDDWRVGFSVKDDDSRAEEDGTVAFMPWEWEALAEAIGETAEAVDPMFALIKWPNRVDARAKLT